MSGEVHDCRACAHSYHEDTWSGLATGCLKAVQVYCGLPQDGPWPHVGSYLGTDRAPIRACKRYVERMMVAERCGADSIDSTTWVQRNGSLRRHVTEYRARTILEDFA